VSKTTERAEKICLNCNAELYGRFCHVCGQENKEPKESVWHLVSHFFYDITHFDGKFFSTLKYLIAKPGFLSSEYIRGRRNRYLNPIRMYVFTSALFFLVFFSVFTVKGLKDDKNEFSGPSINEEVMENMRSRAYEGADNKEDSAQIDSGISMLKQVGHTKKEASDKIDSADKKIKTKMKTTNGLNLSGWLTEDTLSMARYDSIQKALPADQKDNWLKSQMKRKVISLNERYRDKPKQFWVDLLNKFIHMFPYLLFISLPLYALYLKLLYIRRKQFYFVDHGILLIHLYIFTFIFMLVYFLLDKLGDNFNLSWMVFVKIVLFLYGIYYAYRSMRNFYKQGFFKTFLKFCLLNLLAFVSVIFLFSIFFVLSIFQL